jgi:hypothetical protein
VGGDFQSIDGPALVARSKSARGATFSSGHLVAQIQLAPQKMPVSNPVPATPIQFDPNDVSESLPSNGEGGDLLVTRDGEDCALWFCTRRQLTGESGAVWAQVLLGDPVTGQS